LWQSEATEDLQHQTLGTSVLLYIRLIQKQRLSDRNSFTEEA